MLPAYVLFDHQIALVYVPYAEAQAYYLSDVTLFSSRVIYTTMLLLFSVVVVEYA
jgi:hypothetical protein